MSFLKENNKKKLADTNIKVSESMRDYSKEDFFVKKVEKARAFLKKWGLPKELSAAK